MVFESWKKHSQMLNEMFNNLSFQDSARKEIEVESGFDKWLKAALSLRKNKGVMYLIGNGASASMASHFAADLAKNGQIHTQIFTDISLITAISNDIGYDSVFLEPLKRRATSNDMLISISSSGKSRNVLLAMEYANSIGMTTVSLSGMATDNPLRKMGTLNIFVPGSTYGVVETCHATILHHWMDSVVANTELLP